MSDQPTPTPRERAAAHTAAHARPRTATPDQGVVHARIPRGDGTEFRVSQHAYEGRDFLRLGLWRGDWPLKGKTTTVRMSEAGVVVTALLDAIDGAL